MPCKRPLPRLPLGSAPRKEKKALEGDKRRGESSTPRASLLPRPGVSTISVTASPPPLLALLPCKIHRSRRLQILPIRSATYEVHIQITTWRRRAPAQFSEGARPRPRPRPRPDCAYLLQLPDRPAHLVCYELSSAQVAGPAPISQCRLNEATASTGGERDDAPADVTRAFATDCQLTVYCVLERTRSRTPREAGVIKTNKKESAVIFLHPKPSPARTRSGLFCPYYSASLVTRPSFASRNHHTHIHASGLSLHPTRRIAQVRIGQA